MILYERYSPKILVQITLSHEERGNLKFQFGNSETNTIESAKSSNIIFDPVATGFTPGASGKSLIAGANYSFDGTIGEHDGSFTFDLTDIDNDYNTRYWFFRLENTSNKSGKIKSYKIIDLDNNEIKTYEKLPIDLKTGETVLFIKK